MKMKNDENENEKREENNNTKLIEFDAESMKSMTSSTSSKSSRSVISSSDDDVISYASPAKRHRVTCSGFGLFLCGLSAAVFASNTTLAKLITTSAAEKSLAVCFTEFYFVLPLMTYRYHDKARFPDLLGPPGMFKFLILRGVLGFGTQVFMYYAVQRISVGDATSISFCSIIFTGVIARIWLGESFTLFDGFLACLSFMGVILIARPAFIFGAGSKSYELDEIIGIGFALLSALCISLAMIVIRRLGKTNQLLIVFYFLLCCSVLSVITGSATNAFSMPCHNQLVPFFLLGLTGLANQVLFTLSLQYERASTVAVLRSLQIVFAFILQVFVLHDVPSLLSFGGALLILTSALGMTGRKLYRECSVRR